MENDEREELNEEFGPHGEGHFVTHGQRKNQSVHEPGKSGAPNVSHTPHKSREGYEGVENADDDDTTHSSVGEDPDRIVEKAKRPEKRR
jgi:hypothetical protein